MNTDTPKKKKTLKKTDFVDNSKTIDHIALNEIKNCVDKADIEVKLIHESTGNNDKPTIDQKEVGDTFIKPNGKDTDHINRIIKKAIINIEKSQKKMERQELVLRIAFAFCSFFLAWNVYKFIQSMCR